MEFLLSREDRLFNFSGKVPSLCLGQFTETGKFWNILHTSWWSWSLMSSSLKGKGQPASFRNWWPLKWVSIIQMDHIICYLPVSPWLCHTLSSSMLPDILELLTCLGMWWRPSTSPTCCWHRSKSLFTVFFKLLFKGKVCEWIEDSATEETCWPPG